MLPPSESPNAPAPSGNDTPTILPQVLTEDQHVFPMLAALARHLGRMDLVEEFQQRAGGEGVKFPPGPSAEVDGSPTPNEEVTTLGKRGLRLIRGGQLEEAVTVLRQAVRLRPEATEVHANMGVALARLGRQAEAEAAFRIALRLQPVSPSGYSNLGTACLQQGRPQEAERAFREALQLRPDDADVRRHLATALEAGKQFDAAEAEYRESIRLNPTRFETHSRLAALYRRRGKHKEAEASYREALRLKKDTPEDWSNLGGLLESEGRHAEAVVAHREACRLDPRNADYLNNLGVAQAGQGQPEQAIESYERSLALRPDFALAHNNLGNSLRALGRLDEASAHLEHALRLTPRSAEAHNNLGIVRVQQGQVAAGLAHYEEAIRLRKDYPEAHLNRSLVWLAECDFARGWPEYEWRFKMRHATPPKVSAPRWEGRPLDGRTLLLQAEQGLGDTLQFVRFASLVPRGSGGRVLLECPAAVASLAATCPGVDGVATRNQSMPAFDAYAPLMSLPGLLGTTAETIPAEVPYVRVDEERVAFWRQELRSVPGLRVGIAWQGSKQHRGDRQRSVPLARFAALAALPGISLCSLQKGDGVEQLALPANASLGALDLGARTGPDFADVAALMKALDLVVAVDTSLAHAAGALGVPVWVALPFAADWRWQRGREDSPWYPTMRLFRQSRPGDWDSVFAGLAAALGEHKRSRA